MTKHGQMPDSLPVVDKAAAGGTEKSTQAMSHPSKGTRSFLQSASRYLPKQSPRSRLGNASAQSGIHGWPRHAEESPGLAAIHEDHSGTPFRSDAVRQSRVVNQDTDQSHASRASGDVPFQDAGVKDKPLYVQAFKQHAMFNLKLARYLYGTSQVVPDPSVSILPTVDAHEQGEALEIAAAA
ncbi:MAG: hypothetical protein ACREX0_17010 [Noviherbaspirillum sp.]